MNNLNPMQSPIFWKALNLKSSFWIKRSLYRSWNIYNISQFNLQSINSGKRSLRATQVKQIFRHGTIYSPTLVTKSKNFWLASKIMNCCPALDNNVLFGIVSKEWFRCINYLEPGIMAEHCFISLNIKNENDVFFSDPLFSLRFTWSCFNFLLSTE
jgi:hypothetical protein